MTQEEFHQRYQYNPNTDCLGEGGFGKVYKAYDTHRDRWVAIKMAEVRPYLEEVRLKKEVELISKLPTHPNIAYYEECYTFSTFAGEYDFGILQYYELGNLQQLLTTTQLTDGQKDSLLRQILEGITFLHNQGIIHRDIKPQNILIVNRNGEYIPKITDFGISKKLDTNKSSVFTNSLAGAGTLAYASPEQLCGLTIKKNTDLWSFGVIAYWVFLDQLPFNTGNLTVTSEAGRIELFKQITNGEIPALLSQLNSPWDEVVKQCLVADNEKRLGNSSECSLLLEGKTVIEKGSKMLVKKPALESLTTVISVEKKETKDNSFNILIYSVIAISLIIVVFFGLKNNETYVTDILCLKNNETYVTDIDGNVYKTVIIGTQTWMAENLKTTRYNDGTSILYIDSEKKWGNIQTGAYCWYNNDPKKYGITYGALYNWSAVNDGKIAPMGWHIPSDIEWATLIAFLGGKNIAGSKMKEIGTTHWYRSEGVTNESHFTALPAGYRLSYGKFESIRSNCFWWSSTIGSKDGAWSWYLNFGSSYVYRNGFNKVGFSVRCVKDY